MPQLSRAVPRLFLGLLLTCLFAGSFRPALEAKGMSQPPDPSSPFGIAGAMRWPDWGTFSQPADAMLQTGGSWTREDFVWGLIQPSEKQFNWTPTDRIVSTLRDRGINILGIISYSASWATATTEDDRDPVSFYPPDNSKYYWFVRALVTRYKGSVHDWEIWNEPDNPTFWKPRPDAHQYAELLKTAYRAVKDADPSAKVLSAGVSGNAVPFLEEMLQSGAGNSFDILALHPYAVPLNPEKGREESRPEVHKMVDIELSKYRAFLQRHNLDRPIWVTEVGWPAGNWKLDVQAQADYLAQAYAQMLASGLVERIFWYSFKDASSSGADSWGLIAAGSGNMDLTARRPAFNAYATSARMLSGTRAGGRLQVAPFTIVEDFEKPEVWARSTSPTGDFTLAADQHHGGASAGALKYSFTGPNQAVDFAAPSKIDLPGRPTRLGLWVRGDASGDYLSAWLRDRDGELFKVRLGAVGAPADGWRYYEARINNYYFDWEYALGSPSNGVPDYPLQFTSFRLENTPDEPAGSGTIYVDDLQSFDGPDVSAVRFIRADGQVVDVLWSVEGTEVNLPTRSKSAQVTTRDGASISVEASGGILPLKVGSSPIYVVHSPAPAPTPVAAAPVSTGPAPLQVANPACLAYGREEKAVDAGSLYFAETGHNLAGAFRTYWEQGGGLGLFGFPITEEFTGVSSDGKTYRQQYFQRARMEYHPENAAPNDVLLGLLGVWTTSSESFPHSATTLDTSSLYISETGHALRQFRTWWTARGGVPIFGYPLSDEVQEKSPTDGKTYSVQYFERNRLEYHPEFAGTQNEVLLGLLGTEYLAQQGCR